MLSFVKLSVIMLNVIMLSVIILSVAMLNVIMLNVVMLSVIMLNAIMLNGIMLNVIMLNVIMLNVVMLNVITLNVAAPKKLQFCSFEPKNEEKIVFCWIDFKSELKNSSSHDGGGLASARFNSGNVQVHVKFSATKKTWKSKLNCFITIFLLELCHFL
jgi:hypothetical protein